jgi:hypothetical protein
MGSSAWGFWLLALGPSGLSGPSRFLPFLPYRPSRFPAYPTAAFTFDSFRCASTIHPKLFDSGPTTAPPLCSSNLEEQTGFLLGQQEHESEGKRRLFRCTALLRLPVVTP